MLLRDGSISRTVDVTRKTQNIKLNICVLSLDWGMAYLIAPLSYVEGRNFRNIKGCPLFLRSHLISICVCMSVSKLQVSFYLGT